MKPPGKPVKLFRALFKVLLKPEHPEYWEWEYGWLHVWLFDQSPESAALRADAIVAQLPYQVERRIEVVIDLEAEKTPEIRQGEASAHGVGVSLLLISAEIGSDAERFTDRCPKGTELRPRQVPEDLGH